MGKACRIYGKMINAYILFGKTEGKGREGNSSLTLKRVLKWGGRMWTKLCCLRTGFCEHSEELQFSLKKRGIERLDYLRNYQLLKTSVHHEVRLIIKLSLFL
jgi:hypothetical protein